MKRMSLKLAASVVALGFTTIGCTQHGGGIESAGTMSEARAAKVGAKAAGDAQKALAKGRHDKAVTAAELAVASRPDDAGYRALLGQAYMAAGRFSSAEAALRDSLTLNPADGRAALTLALAQTARGDWAGARATLNAHQAIIAPADRGLAFSLAGDPVLGVDILGNAARAPDADAKTRQNLALALALSGRWAEAKVIASQDMAPQDVDARIMQWARFSQPKDAADQVASLLNVTPAFDPGQPTRLALVQPTTQRMAEAEPVAAEPFVDAPELAEAAAEPAAPVIRDEPAPEVAQAVEAARPMVEQAMEIAGNAGVVFLPRGEVVQSLPAPTAPLIRADRAPVRTALADRSAVAPVQGDGRYVVQIGAYDSVEVAEDRWNHAARRNRTLAAYTPSSMVIANGQGAGLVRVSLAGFDSEGQARSVCRTLKAGGTPCFVRLQAADAPVRWASVQRRLASR